MAEKKWSSQGENHLAAGCLRPSANWESTWSCPRSCPVLRLRCMPPPPSSFCPPLPGPLAWSSLEPPGLPLGRSDEEQEGCAPGGAQSSPGPPPAPRNPPRNHVNTPFLATAQCVAWTSHYKRSTNILIIIVQYFLECMTIFITVHLSLSYFQFLLSQSHGSDYFLHFFALR